MTDPNKLPTEAQKELQRLHNAYIEQLRRLQEQLERDRHKLFKQHAPKKKGK